MLCGVLIAPRSSLATGTTAAARTTRPTRRPDLEVQGLELVRIDPSVIMLQQQKIGQGSGLDNPDLDDRPGQVLSTKCVTLQSSDYGFYLGAPNKRVGLKQRRCTEGECAACASAGYGSRSGRILPPLLPAISPSPYMRPSVVQVVDAGVYSTRSAAVLATNVDG